MKGSEALFKPVAIHALTSLIVAPEVVFAISDLFFCFTVGVLLLLMTGPEKSHGFKLGRK